MIVPDIEVRLAFPQVSYGSLPMVDIVDTVAVRGTSARKTYEARLQVGNGLGKVLAKAVGVTLVSVLREKRDEVQFKLSHLLGLNDEGSILCVADRCEDCLLLSPLLGCSNDGRCQTLAILNE